MLDPKNLEFIKASPDFVELDGTEVEIVVGDSSDIVVVAIEEESK